MRRLAKRNQRANPWRKHNAQIWRAPIHLRPSQQSTDAEPLLRPKAFSVVTYAAMCIGLDLISDPGGVISQLKIGRPHQHVPPGKQYTKVVPAQDNLSGISGVAKLATFGGLNGFMP